MTFASKVEISNMSLSGVAIETDRSLRVGGEYALNLELQDTAISVKAVVVWSALREIKRGAEGQATAVYSSGMRFAGVLSEKLMELLKFIDEHKLVKEHRLGGVRFDIDAPGKALLDVPYTYRVKLISLSGMLIETEHQLEIDHVCPMELYLEPGPPVRFFGKVAYCTEKMDEKAKGYKIGVAFLEMASEEKARLEEFIRSLSKQ